MAEGKYDMRMNMASAGRGKTHGKDFATRLQTSNPGTRD